MSRYIVVSKDLNTTYSVSFSLFSHLWFGTTLKREGGDMLTSFHPEMALFRNLGVNLLDCLYDVPNVRLRAIP
jgi:hypothetical protein